mmetsp:Transcript_3665/g.5456  ORF Transcript_3665/g.5456 Transcript_3665/m.5456 type:complete len:287 (-) Transcript_3665:14-874(-)|eukprot:CAMPEP_0201544192 /NCGR_PEP_ID=MMETSP0173_2-20130828/749_1 /ASSEMBLY_ACC=CAM_ASM_000268 /TAXON_ID=218659 /ORGANISM="Vexillifera sp., Strain DIVA3 564/2" /LENGTH=286 /DNA_ID=CAMNT_0047952225 /DNA_START=19 /DNA_END=879 /DNA_ORIENTATION=-
MSADSTSNPNTEQQNNDQNDSDSDSDYHWVPLESNPEMLNEFCERIGMENGNEMRFTDCYGLDSELLAMIARPVRALIFLFPAGKMYKAKSNDEETPLDDKTAKEKGVFYLKQLVHNACGSIAVMHCLINNIESVKVKKDSFLAKFIASTKDMDSALERGKYLGIAGRDLRKASQQAATGDTAQTAAPQATAKVEAHFVAFVNVGGEIYELDGCKKGAVSHGEVKGDFLECTAKVVQDKFISKLPSDELAFSLITFGASDCQQCPVCNISLSTLELNSHVEQHFLE